jgi:hypothetical protein
VTAAVAPPARHWAPAVAACAQVLAKAGAQLDQQEEDDGHTPLMLAALNDQAGCVRRLLTLGADTSLRSRAGETALEIASLHGRQEVAALLSSYYVAADHRHRSGGGGSGGTQSPAPPASSEGADEGHNNTQGVELRHVGEGDRQPPPPPPQEEEGGGGPIEAWHQPRPPPPPQPHPPPPRR